MQPATDQVTELLRHQRLLKNAQQQDSIEGMQSIPRTDSSVALTVESTHHTRQLIQTQTPTKSPKVADGTLGGS